ncbi:uncharacterized protein LOC134842843 [Symsagittifera roscoffensis]|uniref:uncharacterized protein LOC134842843 n=1 Tax=Symsagittifera roscoffensis TaxID=84072 RepID=UPI00307BB45D
MPSMRGRGIRGRLVPNPSVVGNLPVNTPPSMDLQSRAMDAPGIMPTMGGRGGFGGVSAYPRGGRGRGSMMGVGMGMDVGGGTGILGTGFAIGGQDEQGVFCDMERYETEMEYRAWYDQFGKMYYKVHGPDVDPEKEQELKWEKEFYDRDHGPDPRHPYYPKWVSKHFADESCIQQQDNNASVNNSLAIDLNRPTLNDLITVPDPTELTDLIEYPGRRIRPPKIVLILRGPPGSGKSFLARLIKEREVILGDHAKPPRILSIDDYYITEEFIKKESAEEQRNAKITLPSAPRNKIVQYEYDESMEAAYNLCMFKCFKKSLENDLFSFLIVDNTNHLLSDFEQYLDCAKLCGYKSYLVELKVPASTCFKRNTHKRSRKDMERIITTWEDAPEECVCLDYNSFLEEHAEPSPVKENPNAAAAPFSCKSRKRSHSPSSRKHSRDRSSSAHRKSSKSGRVLPDTIMIDSRSPSPEQVISDKAREESPLSFRPRQWSPRGGSSKKKVKEDRLKDDRARAGFPKRTHRSPSPMASVHLRSHKREHEIISNDFTPLRMIERQRTPSIERLLKDTSGVVTMEKTPPRRRTGSPVRRNKNSRSSGSGNATGLSSSRIPSQGQGIQLDLDGDMSKVKRRTISRSKSPVRKSATSMSTSSRYQRRSKSKSTERHSHHSRRR